MPEPAYARDLLIADHKYIGDLFQKNEQGGETRFNIFVTLMTGGIGGLVALMSKPNALHEVSTRVVVVVGFASLLLIGYVIWRRMIKREIASDRFKDQLDTIRETFKQHCDGAGVLDHYDLFAKSKSVKTGNGRTFGGLTDMVAVLNGLLAAGLTATIVLAVAGPFIELANSKSSVAAILAGAAIAAVVGIAVARLQIRGADREEKKAQAEAKKSAAARGAPTHAGGVVYAVQDGTVRYLLVGPKSKSVEWLLPQGHIEDEESHADAALREVREESGVVAVVVSFVKRVQFDKQGNSQDVQFYLMEKVGEVAPDDDRLKTWLPLQEAVAKLSYKESKSVVQAADRRLRMLKSLPMG